MPQKHAPVPVKDDDDEITLKSCATEFFRWVRKGVEVVEETPEYLKSCAEDVQKAWDESGKR